ncbi:MAG: anthranilate synthase component I [Candidatus Hydrothermarchaeaceae archaeon]
MELSDVKTIARDLGYPSVIPLVKVIKADLMPTDVYAVLRKKKPSFLLESAITAEKIARYSFLGNSPEKLVEIKNGMVGVNDDTSEATGDPLGVLREMISGYSIHKDKHPRFFGGLLGYFSYDLIRYYEDIGDNSTDDLAHDDAEFMLVKNLLVFDHWREEILLVSNILLHNESEIEAEYESALKSTDSMENIVKESRPLKVNFNGRALSYKSNFARKDFEEAVIKVKEHIYAGDIFQGVLSQRFECETDADSLMVYLALKEINPSPYMYFLEFNGLSIVGSSPEILARVDGRKIIVRPIAGTRPRGKDAVEDERLSREMMNDPKERAEHVMLVDLGRNDVGRVSRFGSVVVDEFMGVEKYSHVQHIVSNVVGDLREDSDALDAFIASFPAGTVTGAPKVRAMQILDELEPTRRGVYAGSVGYFSFDQNMDFAITIRTIVMHDDKAYVQAGAGIVADSDPSKEYQETVNKARGMLRAIEIAGADI